MVLGVDIDAPCDVDEMALHGWPCKPMGFWAWEGVDGEITFYFGHWINKVDMFNSKVLKNINVWTRLSIIYEIEMNGYLEMNRDEGKCIDTFGPIFMLTKYM